MALSYGYTQPMSPDKISIVEAAIAGLQLRRDRIDARIAELRSQLEMKRNGRPFGPMPQPAPRRKRHVSAATRKRMAEAQRKRWAAVRRKSR